MRLYGVGTVCQPRVSMTVAEHRQRQIEFLHQWEELERLAEKHDSACYSQPYPQGRSGECSCQFNGPRC